MGLCINRYGFTAYVGQLLLGLHWGFLHLRCPGVGAVQWLPEYGLQFDNAAEVAKEPHNFGQWLT